jgi:DNA-directed RNA polymerase alpha subunit
MNHPKCTDLLELEISGELTTQLRNALERAGITDLRQLHGRTRAAVLLILGVGEKSDAIIDAVMRKAGLILG